MNMPEANSRNIAVIGAGIVGVPMAALLAEAGHDVTVIQRASPTSGWKVEAINSGRSPIGGVEPELDGIVAAAHAQGRLRASSDFADLAEADAILICVQTDKKGYGPDYRPLEDAVHRAAEALKKRRSASLPLIIFESTLAPTSMATWVSDRFSNHGFVDGRTILLGNSPNRVMPGRLVDRIRNSDKVAGGLDPRTPRLIRALYAPVVRNGTLHLTNSLTAEIVKTLENAYRDVRIAFSAEIARACEDRDIDFYRVRDEVNRRLAWSDGASAPSTEIPTGGLLIPTIGVGGHCLPKDGILLLWRLIESGANTSSSLILESRRINDEAPDVAISLIERDSGSVAGKRLALLGTAYRPDSEDTRNSPTLVLANHLLSKGAEVVLHDPYVKSNDQNLRRAQLTGRFTREFNGALRTADSLVFCAAHRVYREELGSILRAAPTLKHIYDGCNLLGRGDSPVPGIAFHAFGRGRLSPPPEFIEDVERGFRAMETGFANEIDSFIRFANDRYVSDAFNRVEFARVKAIAETCTTGCLMAEPGPVRKSARGEGSVPRLVQMADRR